MIIYLSVFLVGEIIAYFLFRFVDTYFRKKLTSIEPAKTREDYIAIFKGVLERCFIYISLLNNLPHALTVFGALKIGTRLEEEKKHRVSNDYFFIGNMLSVLMAILYYLAATRWTG